MEAFGIYILKVTALISVFFLAYYFFLRRETFFNANRGYLLAGLFTSVLLPLISFTKIIWVERVPLASVAYTDHPYATETLVTTTSDAGFQINYHYLFGALYAIGILLLIIRSLTEYRSLKKILEKPKAVTRNNFHFIDTEKVQSPFSFFNYIVYNSKLLQQDELTDIIEHEKIHSRQKHSLDMMIAQAFCILFWFNPVMWLYKKAIAQNLEFIADSEATKVVNDIKAYQKTLVKVTMQTQCIAITNHFYQSLIKKRIVMLNTNQSRKRNLWKYLIILPLLAFFILQFQVKILAQEKNVTTLQPNNTPYSPGDNVTVIVDKNTTDAELKKNVELLKNEYNINLKYCKVKRNKQGEITRIKVEYKDKEGNSGTTQIDSDEPITPIRFVKKTDSNGKTKVGFSSDVKAQGPTLNRNTKVSTRINDTSDASEDESEDKSFGDYLSNLLSPPSPPNPPSPISPPNAISPVSPPTAPAAPTAPTSKSSSSVIIKNGKVTTTSSSRGSVIYVDGDKVWSDDDLDIDTKEIARKALEDARLAIEKAKPEIERARIEAMKGHEIAMKEQEKAMKAREIAFKERDKALETARKEREKAMKNREAAFKERDKALEAARKEREKAMKQIEKELQNNN